MGAIAFRNICRAHGALLRARCSVAGVRPHATT